MAGIYSSETRREGVAQGGRFARRLVAAALAVSLLGPGCLREERAETFYGRVSVPTRQEFRWSDGGLPRVFDPAIAASPPDTDVVRAMFEGLTDYDPRTLAPVPAVAESWEREEGGRAWTFHLRPEARWSNGDPVTAHDFVRSWKRTLRLGGRSPHAALMKNIAGASAFARSGADEGEAAAPETGEAAGATGEAPAASTAFGAEASDDRTLRVSLERPDENFPALVAHPVFRPVHELGAYSDLNVSDRRRRVEGEPVETTLITNGAFRLSGHLGTGLVLERAETYWDAEHVGLERVEFVGAADTEEALASYHAGDLDAVTNANFEPLALKLLAPFRDFRRETYAALTFYQFNAARRPFVDRRVREALALALDVGRLSADVMGGATVPAHRFLPRKSMGEVEESVAEDGGGLRHDPGRARTLLAAAGFPGGAGFPTIRLLVNRNEQQRQLASAVAEMWEGVLGVRTEVVVKSWDEYEAAVRAGDFDVARRSVVMQTPDEEANLLAMFGADILAPHPAAGGPVPGAEGAAEAPRPASAGQTAGGQGTGTEHSEPGLTEEAVLREFPAVPIYFAASYALVKPYVTGFDSNLLDAPSLKRVRIDVAWSPPTGAGPGG